MSFEVQTDINSFLFLNSEPGKKLKALLESRSYLFDDSISFLKPTSAYLSYLESLNMTPAQTLTLEHTFYINGADPVYIFENYPERFKYFVNSINEGVFDFIGKAKDMVLGFLKGAWNSYMDDGWFTGSLHLMLDILTVLPTDWFALPIPQVAGGINGLIYVFQDRWLDAILSWVAAIPFAHLAAGFRGLFKFKWVGKLFDAIFKTGNKTAAATATNALLLDAEFAKMGGMKFIDFLKQLLKDGVKVLYKTFEVAITTIAKAAGYVSKSAEAKILSMLKNPTVVRFQKLSTESDEWIRIIEKEEAAVKKGKNVIAPVKGKTPGTVRNVQIKSMPGAAGEELFMKPTLADLHATETFKKLSKAQQVNFEKAWSAVKSIEKSESLFTKGTGIAATTEGIELAKIVTKYTSTNPLKIISKTTKPEEVKALAVGLLSDPVITKTMTKGDVVFMKAIAEHPQAYLEMLASHANQKAILARAIKTGKVNMTVVTAFRGFLMMVARYLVDGGHSAGCPPECLGLPKGAGQPEIQKASVEDIQKKFMIDNNIQSDNIEVVNACREAAQKIYDATNKIAHDGKDKNGCNDKCENTLAVTTSLLTIQDVHGTGPGNAYGQNTVSNVNVPNAGSIVNKNINDSLLKPLGLPPVDEVMYTAWDSVPNYDEKMAYMCIISIQKGTAVLDDSQAMKVARENIDWLLKNGKIDATKAKQYEEETQKIINDRIKSKGQPSNQQVKPNQPEVQTVPTEEWIKDILDFETEKGYPNFGFTKQTAPQFKNENEAIAQFKKEYLPWVEGLPEPLKPVVADFAFNSENPRASLMVAAGLITPQQKTQMYSNGKLDNDAVNKLWDQNKQAVINKFEADKTGFLNAFDSERIRSYSNTRGADKHLDEWKERVARTRAISDKMIQSTINNQTALAAK